MHWLNCPSSAQSSAQSPYIISNYKRARVYIFLIVITKYIDRLVKLAPHFPGRLSVILSLNSFENTLINTLDGHNEKNEYFTQKPRGSLSSPPYKIMLRMVGITTHINHNFFYFYYKFVFTKLSYKFPEGSSLLPSLYFLIVSW